MTMVIITTTRTEGVPVRRHLLPHGTILVAGIITAGIITGIKK